MNSQKIIKNAEEILHNNFYTDLGNATGQQLNYALSRAAVINILPLWETCTKKKEIKKRAVYISAEYLVGRAFYNNFYSLDILDEVKNILLEKGVNYDSLEDIEDDALGNGGLGRLAACLLDSAATQNLPLDGYGIRYKYGLFKQKFENGFQVETADDWERYGDPWSVIREDEKVTVEFGDGKIYAIPYDMPVIGYDSQTINTLRLWQSEPIEPFDFVAFNNQKYTQAVWNKEKADDICMVIYPNDDTNEGKILRLKQQYFMSSATIQDCLRRFVKIFGDDFQEFPRYNVIQLNDTHPTVSIPEFIRILMEDYKLTFHEAFDISKSTFAYTNHTVMAEALEKWDCKIFKKILPKVYPIIIEINKKLKAELKKAGKNKEEIETFSIIDKGVIHMARMAVYSTFSTNGVAKIHTEILKAETLKNWYEMFPSKFKNITNGVTQRRWLSVCNPQLNDYLNKLGIKGFLKDLSKIYELNNFAKDKKVLEELVNIKKENKKILSDYIYKKEGLRINPNFIFDIQVKRLHEYKRQLMNAFSILYIYYGLKDGSIKDFTPTAFIFGAKSAPGYFRAKGIIKFINEIAKKVNNDVKTKDKLCVCFVSNYCVSYAEKLIPAADVSEQISTAGTEASGTSNMKLMMNGAVTLGTYDGANIEIVANSGFENNYIFGAKVEEIEKIKETYNSKKFYDANPKIKKVVNSLIDGSFSDDSTGMFRELYDSILVGASWHKPDHYFILLDLPAYIDAKLRANKDYKNTEEFSRKCLKNIANSGFFSSDRTIKDYAKEIWKIK